MNDYLAKLKKLIEFKSISTDSAYREEVEKTAEWLKTLLDSYGFQAQLISGQKTNPYVYGSYQVGPDQETILIYGHYDVQPVNDAEAWSAPPFSLTEKDGRLLGRGVVDNKGQLLIHLLTIGELIKENKLRCNVKFFLEGNEETGNAEISRIIKDNQELLACDYVILSDGEVAADRPTIDVGFRGGINLTLKYQSADNNLHSGLYGGAVANSSHEMAELIAKFYDEENRVTIPGFYADVDEISQAEVDNNQSIPFNLKELKESIGIKKLLTEPEYDFYTQTGLRPMLTVTGLVSGYTGEGYSNIIPCQTEARINFRLVNSQDPDKIADLFKDFVEANTPDYIDYQIFGIQTYKPIKLDIGSDRIQAARKVLEEVYQKDIVYKFVGGGVPVIVDFKESLGKETVSISLANEDCNMHGVDENFRIDLVKKGLEFSRRFFSNA